MSRGDGVADEGARRRVHAARRRTHVHHADPVAAAGAALGAVLDGRLLVLGQHPCVEYGERDSDWQRNRNGFKSSKQKQSVYILIVAWLLPHMSESEA